MRKHSCYKKICFSFPFLGCRAAKSPSYLGTSRAPFWAAPCGQGRGTGLEGPGLVTATSLPQGCSFFKLSWMCFSYLVFRIPSAGTDVPVVGSLLELWNGGGFDLPPIQLQGRSSRNYSRSMICFKELHGRGVGTQFAPWKMGIPTWRAQAGGWDLVYLIAYLPRKGVLGFPLVFKLSFIQKYSLECQTCTFQGQEDSCLIPQQQCWELWELCKKNGNSSGAQLTSS